MYHRSTPYPHFRPFYDRLVSYEHPHLPYPLEFPKDPDTIWIAPRQLMYISHQPYETVQHLLQEAVDQFTELPHLMKRPFVTQIGSNQVTLDYFRFELMPIILERRQGEIPEFFLIWGEQFVNPSWPMMA